MTVTLERLAETIELNHVGVTDYRVPVVDGLHSSWFVPVTVAAGEGAKSNLLYGGWVEPSLEELELLGKWSQYILRNYNSVHVLRGMKDFPVDIDPGVNTYSFGKLDSGWVYRMYSWQNQPLWPGFDSVYRFPDLVVLLDRLASWGDEDPNPKWVALRDAPFSLELG